MSEGVDFKAYCAQQEARAALRAINPIDAIDVAAVGVCSAITTLEPDTVEVEEGD